MAGLQHGTTIKTRSLPQDRIVADGGVYDISNTDDDRLVNIATLKDIAEKLSTQKNLLVAKVMAVTNQVLTGVTNPYIVDGITLLNGDKILLTNQTDSTKNGLYTYDSSANTLTIASEFRQLEEFISAHTTLVAITEGNMYSGYLLALTSANTNPTLGTYAISFTLVARLLMAGNGLKTENGIIFGQLDPTTDTGLEITANGFKLNHNQLPGAGGVPILSVPHPDIHSVTGDIVREVNQSGTITINGGTFRRDAVVTSTGFTAGAYSTRRSNQIVLSITAGNVAGLYDIVVANNTLDSEDSGAGTFTVIGSPTLVSVSPTIAAGQTANLTVDGTGFLPLTTFNNAGENYTVNSKSYVNPTTYTVNLTIPTTLISGDYDIEAVNDHASTSAYDSGASGNNLVQVRNSNPSITQTTGDLDIDYASTGVITATGSNLFPSGSLSGANIAISSFDTGGTTQSQTINVSTAGATSADIGIRQLTISDTITGLNGVYTEAIAINYPYLALANPVGGWTGANTSKYTFSGTEITKNVTESTAAGSMIELVDYFRSNYLPDNHFVGKIEFDFNHNAFIDNTSYQSTDCFIYFAPRGTAYSTIANDNGTPSGAAPNPFTNNTLQLFGLHNGINGGRRSNFYRNGSTGIILASDAQEWVNDISVLFFRETYDTYKVEVRRTAGLIQAITIPAWWLTTQEMSLYLYMKNSGVKIRNLQVEGRMLT